MLIELSGSWMWLLLTDAEQQIDFTLKKAKFFDRFRDQLSKRQLKVVRRMFDEGPEGWVRFRMLPQVW